MKNLISLIAVLFWTANYGFGQTEIGAKIGYNYLFSKYEGSFETPSPGSTFDVKGAGYHFGGFYSYMPMDNVFLSAELLITNRRWNEISVTNYDGNETSSKSENFTFYSNYYLEIPLAFKYGINLRRTKFGTNKYLMFYGGPSTHLLIGSKGRRQETFRVDAHDQTTVSQEETQFTKSELRDYFKPIQVGLHGGIQYSFGFGLNVDLRFQQLLMPVSVETESLGVLKQGIATLSVGYNFYND